MNALVVFDSVYGNTEAVARAIAAGLVERYEVRVVPAASASLAGEPADLLVVGGPTQKHGISPGLERLLENLPRGGLLRTRAAAFDTRYHMNSLITGSAAGAAAKRLRRAGCELVARPVSFFVQRDQPPTGEKRRHAAERLEPGEVERATAWARELGKATEALGQRG